MATRMLDQHHRNPLAIPPRAHELVERRHRVASSFVTLFRQDLNNAQHLVDARYQGAADTLAQADRPVNR
jgi:hypothetical protein